MLTLYRYFMDCGSMGDLHGVFIEDSQTVSDRVGDGVGVSFGEVLGKHSDIDGDLTMSDLTVLSTNPVVISELEAVVGGRNISGYNPLDYIPNWDDED